MNRNDAVRICFQIIILLLKLPVIGPVIISLADGNILAGSSRQQEPADNGTASRVLIFLLINGLDDVRILFFIFPINLSLTPFFAPLFISLL